MKVHAIIGGKEITNPFAKGALGFCALAVGASLVAAVIFVVLPLAGVVLGLAGGLLLVAAIALMFCVPIILLFGKKTISPNKGKSCSE